jgi:hypothetical protein|tara:strand:+ start:1381 stop:2061 length:681 start_codon:yes stop_codon:yes gene_type:complete
MPYFGKSPEHGNFTELNDVSGSFDGSTTQFALTSSVGGVAITPVVEAAVLISINGVIQEPTTDYTVSGTNITFTDAPVSTDSFFGIVMGRQLDVGTPSDSTVTSAKLASTFLTGSTDIGAAIADADLFLIDDGAGGTIRKTTAARIKTYVEDAAGEVPIANLNIDAEDIVYMRALEGADAAAQAASIAVKKALRDAPADSAIANASTITNLKAAWDTDVLGDSPYA